MVNGIEKLKYINGTIDSTKLQPQKTEKTDVSVFPGKGNEADATSDVDKIESEYEEAAKALGISDEEDDSEAKAAAAASNTNAVKSATPTGGVSSEDTKVISEEHKELEEQKKENFEKMDKLEDKIEEKAEDAEENIKKAKTLQENLVEEQKEKTEEATEKNVEEFKEANKDGKENMSKSQLQDNIAGDVEGYVDQSSVKGALTQATEDVDEMDGYLGELGDLINQTKSIDSEIKAADKAAEEAEKQKCCDPIGFTMGEGENQVRYDFIKDDGSFDTTSDFLGAQGNWNEMTALDTDGDNKVSAQELQSAGIKAVKTNADGSQSVVGLDKEFGKDFSIDLNSYTQGGSHSAIDTSTGDQKLMGTFDLNIDGQTVNGYNTLDDANFLEDTYGVTNDLEENGDLDDISNEFSEVSEELQPYVNFFELYTEKSEELKEEIAEGFKNIGVTEDEIADINEQAKRKAESNVNIFMKSLNPSEDTETEEAESEEGKVEETDEAKEANGTKGAVEPEEAPVTTPETETDVDSTLASAVPENIDDLEELKLKKALAA